MNHLALILALVVSVLCVALPANGLWSGGSAMYECCCEKSHGCQQSCFMCRNTVFVCNCEQCSCYADVSTYEDNQPLEKAVNNKDLIDILLNGGSRKHGRHSNKS